MKRELNGQEESALLNNKKFVSSSEPSTSSKTTKNHSNLFNLNKSSNNRRSLYQSLPLYWPKGWTTSNGQLSNNSIDLPDPSIFLNSLKENDEQGSKKILPLLQQQIIKNKNNSPKEWRKKRRKETKFFQLFSFNYLKNKKFWLQFLAFLISAFLLFLLIIYFIINFSTFFKNNDNEDLLLKKEIKRLRTAYSDIRPKETQIWLLNTFEFEKKQKRSIKGNKDDKHNNNLFVYGLASLCGLNCTVRLKHGIDNENIKNNVLSIILRRVEEPMFGINKTRDKTKISPEEQVWTSLSPFLLVQSMDSDNHTQISRPQISSACFYTAKVDNNNCFETSIVNLCDQNNGLFGTLAFSEGAFLIEPLIDEEDIDRPHNDHLKDYITENLNEHPQHQRRQHHRNRKSRSANYQDLLRAHLIYPVQTQHFGDDHSERKQQKSNEVTTSPISSEEITTTLLAEQHYIKQFNNNSHYEYLTTTNPSILQLNSRDRRSLPINSANSWDHYVEVLVVADYQMLLYHQQNLENYILTLFATVSSIYRHQSLGVSINMVVVRIIILKNERAGPLISNRAQETLQHFCNWQQLYNDRNDDSLNHHDVAILLTRHDICRATNKCDTLGLAELGTVCDSKRSCAIIEDNGLSAAFTIAHELGHIFNIPHDDERKCAEFMPLNKANYHIMAPTLEYNTNPWSWSACSSAMLIRFLESRKSQTQCIFDKPIERRYYERMFETPAPGATYSVSQQCKFVFGAAAELCPYMPSCRRLWCAVSYGYQMGCRTQHMPWADGTECARQMWCYRGQCVGMSPTQRKSVDGSWGEWKSWGDCSRSCGGGIQKSYRQCDSPRPEHGGKYCTGQRVRYRPCAIHECPWDMPGFREQQCSEFDGKDIGIHGVPSVGIQWVPKYTGVAENERCQLYCRIYDSSAFYKLRDKVIDGTPCDRQSDDICIDGVCHKSGCDHRLGSTVRRDVCGICGGDGTSCHEVKGVYNERGTSGYNEVLRIPAGATNIDITQNSLLQNGGDDENYLALSLPNKEWILNGQHQVSVFRQQITILDTVLEYSGSNTPQERINGTGPLRTDIYLHFLSVGILRLPNIHYRYMDPLFQQREVASAKTYELNNFSSQKHYQKQQKSKAPNTVYWRSIDNMWSDCTLKCQGTQTQLIQCVDTFTNKVMPESMCAKVRKPDPWKRICNIECFYKWQNKLLPNNLNGQYRYQYYCVRSYTNGREEQAFEDECKKVGIPYPIQQPIKQQPTIKEMSPHNYVTDRRWAYTEWSVCSESCGTSGIRRRSIHCIDARNGQKLETRFCEGIPHEALHTECNRTPCPAWNYGEWQECSRSCGGGIRIRHAICQDASGRDVNAHLCPVDKLDSEKCGEQLCKHWRFTDWTACSVSCGKGFQKREAYCVDSLNRPLNDEQCDVRERIVVKQCEIAPCPKWRTHAWSPCSVTCGTDGFQTRLVQCVDSVGRKVADSMCSQQKTDSTLNGVKINSQQRPQSYKTCHNDPCPYWRTYDWSKCSSKCGEGKKKRLVECVLRNKIVDDSICTETIKPSSEERCLLIACTNWEVGIWKECSKTCGLGGVQLRTVNCVRYTSSHNNNRSIVVHDRECTGKKPQHSRLCNLPACPSIKGEWIVGQWSECPFPKPCIKNTKVEQQQRFIECRSEGKLIEDKFCSHLERPLALRSCPPCINIQRSELKSTLPTLLHISAAITVPNLSQKHYSGKWNVGPWNPCSCGVQNEQTRQVWCNSAITLLQRLDENQCDPDRKPESKRNCYQLQDCTNNQNFLATNSKTFDSENSSIPLKINIPIVNSTSTTSTSATHPLIVQLPHWETGPWSECPRHCGQTVRTRLVRCIDPLNNAEIDQTKCLSNEKPETEHRCRHSFCPRWIKSDWQKCNSTCGQGISKREVVCRGGALPNDKLLPDIKCNYEQKPNETRICNLKKCQEYFWRIGRWSECIDACKPGEQRRSVYCLSDTGKHASSNMCELRAKTVKPIETRKCPIDKCPYKWTTSPWSTCTRSCGVGLQFRQIECKVKKDFFSTFNSNDDYNDSTKEIIEPIVISSMCMAIEKPIVTRKCEINPCNAQFFWNVGPWSACSKTCGPGYRRRKVRCLDKLNGHSTSIGCDNKTKPQRREPCFIRNCMPSDCAEIKDYHKNGGNNNKQILKDGNYTVLVAGYKIKVYCHNMNQSIPKTYLNILPKTNFAEFYGKRLAYPYSCPYNGQRNDNCNCTNNGHINQGLTRFNKIRVDLHNMKINPNDFTFALTEYGSPVAYGTAGDCYSMSDCPQGRFSIDLRGTNFKIVEDLEWIKQGHRTSLKIERLENNSIINGLCGGYCGGCTPDRFKGLIIGINNKNKLN